MKVVPGVRKKNKDGDSIPRGAPGIHLPNWAQLSSKYGWISLATWGRSDHWDVLGQRIPKSQAEFSLSSFLSRCCLVYWHLPGTHTCLHHPNPNHPGMNFFLVGKCTSGGRQLPKELIRPGQISQDSSVIELCSQISLLCKHTSKSPCR